MTLTEREKKIMLVKYVIHGNSPFAEASLGDRISMLKIVCTLHGLSYDDEELQKIGQECLDFQQITIDALLSFLSDKENKELYKQAMKTIGKGNDPITKLLGKDKIDDALKIMKGKFKI